MTETPVAGDLLTIPYRWYTDPRVAEAERDTIFRCTWQYAGHLASSTAPAACSRRTPAGCRSS